MYRVAAVPRRAVRQAGGTRGEVAKHGLLPLNRHVLRGGDALFCHDGESHALAAHICHAPAANSHLPRSLSHTRHIRPTTLSLPSQAESSSLVSYGALSSDNVASEICSSHNVNIAKLAEYARLAVADFVPQLAQVTHSTLFTSSTTLSILATLAA